MVLLMVYHYLQIDDRTRFFSRMIQFGLFFSWLGDIALMLPPDPNELLFIAGLLFFLVAHLGYTMAFFRSIKDSKTDFSYTKAAKLAVPFVVLVGSFFYYIKDGLPEDLFIPVLAYTTVITMMGIFSAWRSGHVDAKSFIWILSGAILFILSDCVLAFNKFAIDFEYDALLNAILYFGGQYMIAVGAIFYEKSLRLPQADS